MVHTHTQTSKSVAGIADSTRTEESNPPTVAIEYQKPTIELNRVTRPRWI